MIIPAQGLRIVLAVRPVDFRCGHDALAGLVQNTLGLDPHSGLIVVFRSKRMDRFKVFHIQQAIGFKKHLAQQVSERTDEPLSKATAYSTLAALKAFFQWLCREPGFKHLSYTDADYFSLSLKDTAVAKARKEARVPTLEKLRHVIANMPAESDLEKRNRALIALMMMTSARVDAVASMRLKHVDLVEGRICQDGSQVRTRFRRPFEPISFPLATTLAPFFPNGWISYKKSGFGVLTIHSFPRHEWAWAPPGISKPLDSIANAGRAPRRFGRYSGRRSRRRICPISTLTPFATC